MQTKGAISKQVWTVVVLGLSTILFACREGGPGNCDATGTGEIAITFSGLPSGLSGKVHLSGASEQSVNAPTTITVEAGPYQVTADKAVMADTRVRTVYAPTSSLSSFCLSNGGKRNITVTWAEVPTSHKVWTGNQNGDASLIAFAAADVTASGNPAPAVKANVSGGSDLAFDTEGNLWMIGGTTEDAPLIRFPASALASSANPAPDISIQIAGLDCSPRLAGLAFDANGNLWTSSPCKGAVYRIDASALASAGTVTPSVSLGGLEGPTGLAFDSSGNLWVADAGLNRVLRFDSASLSTSDASPARILGVRASDDTSNNALLSPSWLAFDSGGNLWGNNFGGNILFRMTAADLSGTGAANINPSPRISLSVGAILEGLMFDESGGLWTAYSGGQIARLNPLQLTFSSNAGAPTVPETIITSTDIGAATNLAIYPAPAGTPLYHRLP